MTALRRILSAAIAGLAMAWVFPAQAQQALSTCLSHHRVGLTVGESFHPLPGSRAADHSLQLRGLLGGNLRDFGAAVIPIQARPSPLGSIEGLAGPLDQAETQGATLLLAFGLDAQEQRLVSPYLNGDQFPLRTVRLLLNAWLVDPASGDVLAQFTLDRRYAANSTDEAVAELTGKDLADPLARALRQACDGAPPSGTPPPRPPVIPVTIPTEQRITPESPPPIQTVLPVAPPIPLASFPPASATALPGASPNERRIALIIGNNAYQHAAALANPTHDANAMAKALRELGFDVIERTDATKAQMEEAVDAFGAKLKADSVAVIYYSGHGMQVNGKNFLIPVDFQPTNEQSVQLHALDADVILDQMTAAHSRVNLIILDACRNNPFERRFRAFNGGLAQLNATEGSIIAYATAPGKVASDGEGTNSPYTEALLAAIHQPGMPVEQVFKQVRARVSAETGGAQVPWESSSLIGDFYFLEANSGNAHAPSP